MRRAIRKTGRKKNTRPFLSNRSIITKPEFSHAVLAVEAERQAMAEARMNPVIWGRTPALAKRSIGVTSVYNKGNPYYVEPVVTDTSTFELSNLLAYQSSLRTTVRLDRDFTVAGKRFKAMGAPFEWNEKVALYFADGCIDRAKDNIDENPLRGLVNIYHAIVGLYLAHLNRSFDFLDLLKIVQTSLSEGNKMRSKLLLTEFMELVKVITKLYGGVLTMRAPEKVAKAFAKLAPTVDNLEFGDGGPPDTLELMYGSAWAKIQEAVSTGRGFSSSNYGDFDFKQAATEIKSPIPPVDSRPIESQAFSQYMRDRLQPTDLNQLRFTF
jgi:hypothetical protein